MDEGGPFGGFFGMRGHSPTQMGTGGGYPAQPMGMQTGGNYPAQTYGGQPSAFGAYTGGNDPASSYPQAFTGGSDPTQPLTPWAGKRPGNKVFGAWGGGGTNGNGPNIN